jgi:hypothetical protein
VNEYPTGGVVNCPNCGTQVAANKRRCPSCGRMLDRYWPSAVPPTADMYELAAPLAATGAAQMPRQRRSRLPVWIEFFAGALGIHGIGYLMVGKVRPAVLWLIFSLFWEVLRAVVLTSTLGFGCLCLGPLGLVLALVVSTSLRRTIRQMEAGTA